MKYSKRTKESLIPFCITTLNIAKWRTYTELSVICAKTDTQTQSFTEHILFFPNSACAPSGNIFEKYILFSLFQAVDSGDVLHSLDYRL